MDESAPMKVTKQDIAIIFWDSEGITLINEQKERRMIVQYYSIVPTQ